MSDTYKCPKCHGLGYYDEGHENDDGSMSGGNYVTCQLCGGGKSVTSAAVIAGLEMALSQADAMIERQQNVVKRAIEAWDTTTHQKNRDGRLWQCMEELRMEIVK